MGMAERRKPIPENTVNAVLTAVILAGCDFRKAAQEKREPGL